MLYPALPGSQKQPPWIVMLFTETITHKHFHRKIKTSIYEKKLMKKSIST
jgi:hypothetical protein